MRNGSLKIAGGLAQIWSRTERRQLVVLAVGLGIIAAVWSLRGFIASAKLAGYPGVFFLSFLGSVSMVLPVPGLISLCGFSLVLNPFLLGLLAGVGETIGEISGYAVGYGGGSVIEKRRFYPKLKYWMERRGIVVLFVVSLIPNPVFDVVGIAAGSVRFSLPRFLATVWAGKTLKGIMVGYTCFYGISLLPWVD